MYAVGVPAKFWFKVNTVPAVTTAVTTVPAVTPVPSITLPTPIDELETLIVIVVVPPPVTVPLIVVGERLTIYPSAVLGAIFTIWLFAT